MAAVSIERARAAKPKALTTFWRLGRVVGIGITQIDGGCGLREVALMTALIPAIYEGGVFRPLAPVDLRERERVYVLLLPDESAKVADAQRAALGELIGMGESGESGISSRHDEFLYQRRR